MLLLYKKIVESMWEVAENDPSVPWGSLDEARIEVNVELHQRRITNRLEAMNLTGFDDEDVSRAALEGLVVDGLLHLMVCKYKP